MPGGWNASSDSPELRAAGIIVPIIFSLIFLLGTVGNGLVLAVLLRNGQVKYNTTNLFILNLAMADLCFIVCCVPFQATIYTLDGWLFGAFACKAVHFLIYLTMYASSFTLAAVSIDRYLAIRYPLKSRDLRTTRNAGVAIIVIWSLSLLFAGPYLSYYQIVPLPRGAHLRPHLGGPAPKDSGHPHVCLCIPLTRDCGEPGESRKAKRKVTKMIVAVAILFCLCWLPHHLVILCFWFGHFPFNRATYACRLASHCLSYNKNRKKKKRVGNQVHVVNVGKGFTNSTGGFCGGNTEVTQVPRENTRRRDAEGESARPTPAGGLGHLPQQLIAVGLLWDPCPPGSKTYPCFVPCWPPCPEQPQRRLCLW
uniref:G-protein coupled receptors family 1 profile domain-containing protein n=1 Tax=Anas platyrhynchos TaxID=8839 RepID=A0A8B9ST86_ANAPL